MILRYVPSLVALVLAASAAPRGGADASEVAAAERSFAAMGQTDGLDAAFETWSADDAIVFAPRPVSAKAQFADPDHHFAGRLVWWPVYAGIAASRDLGFTTGPFDFERGKGHGWFFTVWRRQTDGRWRWVLDHGTPTRDAPAYAEAAPLQIAPLGRGSSKKGWNEVLAAEASLASALAADARAALPRYLWDDGRTMRVGPQPAIGRAAFTAAVAGGPASYALTRAGGGISKAGDLAYTYGTAAWQRDGKPVDGHYVHLWQRRPGGWKLLIEEVTPMPPPPPPPPKPSGG